MKKLIILSLIAFLVSPYTYLNAQRINTVAGNGSPGYSGDGGQATLAELKAPNAVCFDRSGNMYICDQEGNRIRMVDLSGVITTFAGNGNQGYGGDNGAATAAQIDRPSVAVFDSSQNMYIADYGNNLVRKINTSGIITTFAGIPGSSGSTGDGGAATAATLNLPTCVITDDTGNVYLSDGGNNVIRKINTLGIISLIAGNYLGGYSGDGGIATAAELSSPIRIDFDPARNLVINDVSNNRIRRVDASGIITTVAGNGVAGFSGDGAPATNAEINTAFGMGIDSYGDILIADSHNERVRLVNTSGIISTIAGNGVAGFSGDGGLATACEIDFPSQVDCDKYNNIYISDNSNNRIRKINNTTGIAQIINSNNIIIYPNPNNGIFTIQLSVVATQHAISIEIYNLIGERVASEELQTKTNEIDLSSQPDGVYLYRVLGEDGNLEGEGKVVVEK